WRPVNVWLLLPPPFNYVESPYRLLVFLSLAAGCLAGFGVPPALGRPLRAADVVLATLLIGALSASYLGTHRSTTEDSIAAETAFPDIGRGGARSAYLLSRSALADRMVRAPGFNWAEQLEDGWVRYPGALSVPRLRPGDVV